MPSAYAENKRRRLVGLRLCLQGTKQHESDFRKIFRVLQKPEPFLLLSPQSQILRNFNRHRFGGIVRSDKGKARGGVAWASDPDFPRAL